MATETPKMRIERDSMGEMEVPADALWGASTQRAVLNFPISDRRFPRAFLRALGLIKLAATVRHEDAGWFAEQVVAYRTQRRLFEGVVLVPASRVPALARTAA